MKKIKDSFGGVIIGILMIIGGTCLLWWNEGNNVKNIKAVNEVEKKVVEIQSDKVDAKNEGSLVLVKGDLVVVDEVLKDDGFPVGIKTAKLNRTVEIYEWKEESESDSDGNTTYKYNKVWEEGLINSSDFHQSGHDNPASVAYESTSFYASDVKVGVFGVTSGQKSDLATDKSYTVSADETLPEGISLSNGYVTTSKDLNSPEVGDLRITWKYNDWTKATILAVQKGDSFEDFVSESGRKINRIFEGEKSIPEVLETMRSEDNAMKWIFRIIGALLIVFGYISFINPLTTLTSFVPFLGGLVGSLLNLVAFLIGLVHSLIVIIIAWFRFRPLLALALLAVVVLAVIMIIAIVKKNKKPKTEEKPVEKEA